MDVVLGVVGGVLLALVVGLIVRRVREGREPVLGTPVTSSPPGPATGRTSAWTGSTSAGAGSTTGAASGGVGGEGTPDLGRLTEGLREAFADGEVTDDEIQRLLPGAKVVRDGKDIVVEHSTTSVSSQRIQGPNGEIYESIDDIPDPAARERLRRILGE